MRRFGLIILALGACQAPPPQPTVPDSLTELEVGETVRVDYLYEGCFASGLRQRVEISRNEQGWLFEAWLPEQGKLGGSLESLGTMWVRPQELAYWDGVVISHRSGAPAGSTSLSVVELSWRRADQTLRSQRFERDTQADEDLVAWIPPDPLTARLREASALSDAP